MFPSRREDLAHPGGAACLHCLRSALVELFSHEATPFRKGRFTFASLVWHIDGKDLRRPPTREELLTLRPGDGVLLKHGISKNDPFGTYFAATPSFPANIPILFFWGDVFHGQPRGPDSMFFSPEWVTFVESTPHGKVVEVTGSDHWLPKRGKRVVNTQMAAWLKSLDEAGL